MKVLALIFAFVLALSAGGVQAQSSSNTVSVSIVPGPFTVSLTRDDDLIVLDVDDLTGAGRGWWVTLDCTCAIVPAGEPIAIAGQKLDSTGGPRLIGRTLIAKTGHGMGRYLLPIQATEGVWTLTYGNGQPLEISPRSP